MLLGVIWVCDDTQDYIIPNNRHATLFYHDHAVGITSENVYAGG